MLSKGGLYKTIKFKNAKYVGDPINTVKIFNEKEADELLLLDYKASVENRKPDYTKIKEIAEEAFMPMAYGGGITTLEDAKKVFDCGFEKIILNSILRENITLIEQIANIYGSQSVVGSIDVKKNQFGDYNVYSHSGTKKIGDDPFKWAKKLESEGAGEIILTSIDNDGTWNGYLLDLIKAVSSEINIPLIACGGAGSEEDLGSAVIAGASAVAASSMFIFQKKEMGVLISFPSSLRITSKN